MTNITYIQAKTIATSLTRLTRFYNKNLKKKDDGPINDNPAIYSGVTWDCAGTNF